MSSYTPMMTSEPDANEVFIIDLISVLTHVTIMQIFTSVVSLTFTELQQEARHALIQNKAP